MSSLALSRWAAIGNSRYALTLHHLVPCLADLGYNGGGETLSVWRESHPEFQSIDDFWFSLEAASITSPDNELHGVVNFVE